MLPFLPVAQINPKRVYISKKNFVKQIISWRVREHPPFFCPFFTFFGKCLKLNSYLCSRKYEYNSKRTAYEKEFFEPCAHVDVCG